MSDRSSDDQMEFNFVHFIKFLRDNNILGVAIAAILSDRIGRVTDSFVNDLIMPILSRDGDGDGEEDIKKLEDKSIMCFGANFRIGKFMTSVIKFVLVTYIIFILAKVVKNLGVMKMLQ